MYIKSEAIIRFSVALVWCGIIYVCTKSADTNRFQEKLYQEVAQVLDPHDVLSYKQLLDLKYTEMVILETMRLFAPIPLIVRKATADIQLGKDRIGFVFSVASVSGCLIALFQYSCFRDYLCILNFFMRDYVDMFIQTISQIFDPFVRYKTNQWRKQLTF